MDMGIGFSEILLIVLLVLVFFGSKELPKFIRECAKMLARIRVYTEKMKRELNEISLNTGETPSMPENDSLRMQKKELRNKYLDLRRKLSPAERTEKSLTICRHLKDSFQFQKADAIMLYVNMGSEVETRGLIAQLIRDGKRVIVPYSRSESRTMGLGEVANIETDIVIGEGKAPEPRPDLRDRFFRSDLQMIVCPGVCFDIYGGRLGRGFAYYDNFLRELRGRVPIFGLAFDCQIYDGHLPFSYSDVPMDQVITESGLLLPSRIAG